MNMLRINIFINGKANKENLLKVQNTMYIDP